MGYYSNKRDQRIKQATETIAKLKELRKNVAADQIDYVDDIINDIYRMIN